jgi:O-antigen/teichoic acid export membrane protein
LNNYISKEKINSAIFWNLSGTIIRQASTFVISIFLARLLSPGDFGLVGMATVFVSLTQSFSDFGMTSGLIQKNNPTEVQYSTVFYINLGISIILMVVLILTSEVIAKYYNNPEVGKIARFVSYSFVINALNGIQIAQLTKALANKIKTVATVSSSVVSGLIGILLAFSGYGVWSLVYASLIGDIIYTGIIWQKSEWRPKVLFNFGQVKPLLNFGSKMFASGLLDNLYNKLDVLIIGKIFSPATLGFYFRAASLNQLIAKYTSGAMQGVFFPVISNLQNDREVQLKFIQKSLHLISFLTFLFMGILYLGSKEIVVLLFSEKWLVSVEYFKIMVFYGYAYPVSVILVNVLSGNGLSGRFLQLEIWKKATGLSALLIGFLFGVEGFLWGMAISTTMAVLQNMWFVQKIINFGFITQIKTVFQYAVFSILSVSVVIWIKSLLPDQLILNLFIGSVSFILIYLMVNFSLKTNGLRYLMDQLPYKFQFNIKF